MKILLRCVVTCVALLLMIQTVPAQISEGGIPFSFGPGFSATDVVPTVEMPPVDAALYLAEDARAPKDTPYRIATLLDVSLDLSKSGVWSAIPNGRIWRLRILSKGAYSIALIYDQWHIPEGGKLFIYNDKRNQVLGAFTSFNNWKEGTNITGHVMDDAVTLEYFEPADVEGRSDLSIFRVVHAYRNVFGRGGSLDDFGESGSCNVNVICPAASAWQTEKRGVGMIIEDGYRICSGSLINNTSQDLTPYFLTANHCYSTEATGWIFVFNYESSTCSPSTDGPTTQTVVNATLRARWDTSDFCLMQLSSNVPTSYNPYFNGWNRVNAAWTSSVCIHHPSCDVKKYSLDSDAPVSDRYLGSGAYTANAHWKIVDWNTGTTEGGSSGSPLFDQNHRITGQLHGGYAACGNELADWYGKFSLSWTGGASNSTRLSNWLDPGSTGVTTLDGTYGATSITVTQPNGGETWLVGDVDSIKWTSSGLSENVRIQINRAYPGATWMTLAASTANDGSHPWTVTDTLSTTARIRITGATTTTVGDTSNNNFTIAKRTITLSAPDGGELWLTGDVDTIKWTSQNLSENVKIELNRSYPGVTWENIIANTANDGAHPWTVSGELTSTAHIRVSGVTHTAVSDTSNNNFTIATRSISVTIPNGGETWLVGNVDTIKWTSQNLSENVKIELNRGYPGTLWETVVSGTTNDGVHPWTVSETVTETARVRIAGVVHSSVGDTSEADFAIRQQYIIIASPNGGESWKEGDSHTITWLSAYAGAEVKIELNRTYPAGAWETVIGSTANSGSYPWIVTSPVTTAARLRIISLAYSLVGDTSDGDFTITPFNEPPEICHDPLHDQEPAAFFVTAIATDDIGLSAVRFIYRPTGGVFDSLTFSTTGNPDEYAVSVGPLSEGKFEYFLRAVDIGGLSAATDTFLFFIGGTCGSEQAYDDGSAEASHWSEQTGYCWAVKFDAPATPYVLCLARIGISAVHPDCTHAPISVQVLAADGAGGLPGTVLFSRAAGSIGNVIGGVPDDVDNWTHVLLRDSLNQPLTVSSAFYIAVANPDANGFEAFLEDTVGARAGRSFVYDPCDSTWHDELFVHSSTRPGNRMIRVSGFTLTPPTIVVSMQGSDVKLDWTATGAPFYRVYSALNVGGPFDTLEGTSATTSFLDIGAAGEAKKFYIVYSSTAP